MTPKEKAQEIWMKFFQKEIDLTGNGNGEHAYQYSLIFVNELWKGIDENFHAHPDKPHLSEMHWNKVKEYWEQVKKELESF